MATIEWLDKNRTQPRGEWGQPQYDTREKTYSVWADLSDRPEWMEGNSGVGECVLAGPSMTEHGANFLVDRLYEVYGDGVRLGISKHM